MKTGPPQAGSITEGRPETKRLIKERWKILDHYTAKVSDIKDKQLE